jgi:hypothetical protein
MYLLLTSDTQVFRALSIVAHGKTFGDVLDEVKRKGVLEDENLTFDFIEEEGAVCVYRVPYI